CTISLIRRGGTPIAIATLCWVTSSGPMKSSMSTSPGWIGANVVMRATSSVIVDNLNAFRTRGGPFEANPPLLVDANAVLPRALPRNQLQPVPRRAAQILKLLSGVEKGEFAQRRTLDVRPKPPRPLS